MNKNTHIEFKCNICGECDYNIKTCCKCKKQICSYKCVDLILRLTTVPICRACYESKIKQD